MLGDSSVECADIFEQLDWPPLRIHNRVAEHFEEDGLVEGVELGEGGAALGPQRFRMVQHIRDSTLFG
jgi:hypothetical protein